MIDESDLQSEFALFLKMHRCNIPYDTPALGSWERLPVRRGRPVTQEEVAEAAGVSRNWYRQLESGEPIRASVKLLDRLARVLGFTPEERMKLFRLGVPEIAKSVNDLSEIAASDRLRERSR